jgi:hypothetical protein
MHKTPIDLQFDELMKFAAMSLVTSMAKVNTEHKEKFHQPQP